MIDGPKGRELWLRAGLELLRQGGIGAVKLQGLTEQLDLTTGSFYHHFTGMAQYREELARFYGSEQVSDDLGTIEESDPRERLRQLDAHASDQTMRPVDRAMRDWAGSNALAAEAVRNADAELFRYVERAFQDLGYESDDARARTLLFLSPGVARVRPPWRVSPTIVDDVLAILAPQ